MLKIIDLLLKKNDEDHGYVTDYAMTTKVSIGIAFRKARVCAKFHCPSSKVTLFSEDGEGESTLPLVKESQKSPAIAMLH